MNYDSDKLVPMYGFGAVLPGQNQVNHCFPLSLNGSDPNAYQVEGMLDMYKNVVNRLSFAGPTYFSEILRNIEINARELQR